MLVLDTDHMSVLERRDQPAAEALRARLAPVPPEEVVTTIINYEEQMRGWMAYLARTRSVAQQVEAYRRLAQHLDNYRRIPVLAFDEAAAMVFHQLRRARLRIGTMDLKIAAIVLSREATLLSRNLADFRQVPGLQVEDWTVGR
jgi:tRNA(fMet)-specific endonuclease VapC